MEKQIRKFFAAILVLCLIANGFSGTPLLRVSADVNTGLAAYYKFDGDLKDSSGNGNNGTMEGSGITFVDAKFGKGAKFDGASYITVADSDSQDLDNQFSIVAWIYKEKSATNFAPVIAKGENDYADISTPYALYYDYNGMRPLLRQATDVVLEEMYITELLQSNQRWHQLAVTKNGKSVNFYIDGVLSGTQICEAERLFASDGKLYIGASVVDFNAYFKGVMDDLRIYNRALSNDEIKAILAGTANQVNSPATTNPATTNPGTPPATPTPTPAAETPPGTTPTPAPTPTPTPSAPTTPPTGASPSATPATSSSGKVELISKTNTGEPVGAKPYGISRDGRYVVFKSSSDKLQPRSGAGYSSESIFVYDRTLQMLKNVCLTNTGEYTWGGAESASISGDGRYVAFVASDRKLVPNDNNQKTDVFYHDLQTGMTKRITNANGDCYKTAISNDGRYIVFASYATNLHSNDINGDRNADIYVYDRSTEKIELVHVSSEGVQGNGGLLRDSNLSISDDGRFVAYVSSSSNLVDDDTNNSSDVFIYGRQTKENVRLTNGDKQFTNGCINAILSGDSRYIVFESQDASLRQGNNGSKQIYVYDRNTKKIEIASISTAGMPADSDSVSPNITSDGRYVVFNSYAKNLAPDLTDAEYDGRNVYIHDRQTKKTQIVDVTIAGKPASYTYAFTPFVSDDGHYAAFWSCDIGLIEAMNSTYHPDMVFVRDMSEDAAPPSWPAGSSLSANGVTNSEVTLNWSEAMDGEGITGYKVYTGQTLIGSTDATIRSYTVRGLRPGTTYSFRVEAFDQAENFSTGGPAVTITTSK